MAAIANNRLTLEQFVLEIARIPREQLDLEALRDLVRRLDVCDDLIRQHIRFRPDSYARNLVCRTPAFDMLVLCWRPGQQTVIHDHGESLNVTRVVGGRLCSRMFVEAARPEPGRVLVRPTVDELLDGMAFSCVDAGEIHQLANTSEADLVTLHVYARPLKDIRVYCPNTGEVDTVRLRYTLEDDYV
ncbi:MAG: hypothetical protein KatS3mg102_0225 [Planctomycetota bacterium]|nr:MAG: hypothetical protein KatS3mg102_0225 [Planctomycetota bacterium]